MTKYALVGDVGGTNARLALCDVSSGEISRAKTYSGLDYPSLEAVVRVYLDEQPIDVILAEAYDLAGLGKAFMNRLEKAASSKYPKKQAE